jgi:thymidylate synthase
MARYKDDRTDIQKAENRKDIASLYVRGATQAQIAGQLNLSQPTVCRDLKVIHTEWRREMLGDFDERKARELAKIDELEREYWDAWKVSKAQREISTTAKETEGAQAGQTSVIGRTKNKAQLRREQRDGNPAFLTGLQWCIEQRCKVFGFYAPTKVDVRDLDRLIEQEFALIKSADEQQPASNLIQ